MARQVRRAIFVLVLAFSMVPVGVASADHTNPRQPLVPLVNSAPADQLTRGEGTWTFIENFIQNPTAGEDLSGGGTDLEFWDRFGVTYASFGTLGQGDELHVGQRFLRLTDRDGNVDPTWVADHGSANCEASSSVTSLQHDVQLVYDRIAIDTTDASGRCHDTPGGGQELIDVSRIQKPSKAPREIHLIRYAGTSHTTTVDATRPWIVYNSTSDFAGRPWIDVADIRTCILPYDSPLQARRDACRPLVYRMAFDPTWTQAQDHLDGELHGGSAACHDITARPGRLYCAALNATLIIDVSRIVDRLTGMLKGTPLPCVVVPGTQTDALVTNCANPTVPDDTPERLEGASLAGLVHHVGRDCNPARTPDEQPNTSCNSNLLVPSAEGVSVAHEADPTGDNRFMVVTDERGGGIVPPGATCTPGMDSPYSNGGGHFFDISNPRNIRYAMTRTNEKAVYISDAVVPAPTFCDIHVMEFIPGRQRFIAAYYTQGVKIVDYFVDRQGRIEFEEVASWTAVGVNSNTWAAEHFKIVRNGDGTETYYIMTSDIARGADVISWTGPRAPALGASAPAQGSVPVANAAIGGLGLIGLPLAAVIGRRRRRRRAA